MNSLIPVSAWAKMHGLSRKAVLDMIRRDKVPGATLKEVMTKQWYIPEDARPDYTDRRYKSARQREKPDTHSA